MHLDRARLLLERRRFGAAAEAARQAIAEDPESGPAHAVLALCLVPDGKIDEALREARLAVQLAPDRPLAHHALAAALFEKGRHKEARASIEEMIRLDPFEPDHHALLAMAAAARARWEDMLAAAERGIELDSEHVDCTNLRAFALRKLRRKDEAAADLDAALALDPENSETHAHRGWQRLEAGDTKGALAAFRASLRLDADNEWAREGIVEALKARHLLYRVFLGYVFWMARLSGRAQLAVLVGAYVLYRIVLGVQRSRPELSVWLTPLLGVYIAFVVLTWIGAPLFDLLLLLHPVGRHALPRERVAGAAVIGLLLAATLAALGVMAASSGDTELHALLFAAVTGTLLIPASGFFSAAGRGRRVLGLLFAAEAALGAGVLLGLPLLTPWLICVVASPWIVNVVLVRGR